MERSPLSKSMLRNTVNIQRTPKKVVAKNFYAFRFTYIYCKSEKEKIKNILKSIFCFSNKLKILGLTFPNFVDPHAIILPLSAFCYCFFT